MTRVARRIFVRTDVYGAWRFSAVDDSGRTIDGGPHLSASSAVVEAHAMGLVGDSTVISVDGRRDSSIERLKTPRLVADAGPVRQPESAA